MFQFILVGSLVIVSVLIANLSLLLESSIFVVFVMVLSFISSLQMAWRVREINIQERRIVTGIGSSVNKHGIAKDMVDDLFMQGAMGDGRIWFALYRIAQEPNPVGYIIRDVLIEKNREITDSRRYVKTERKDPTSKSGPGIES